MPQTQTKPSEATKEFMQWVIPRAPTLEEEAQKLDEDKQDLVDALRQMMYSAAASEYGRGVAKALADTNQWPEDAPSRVSVAIEDARKALARHTPQQEPDQ